MERVLVGYVTEIEKKEIMALYERKNALEELLLMLNNNKLDEIDNEDLYERVSKDIEITKMSYNQWWRDMSSKYKWKSIANKKWSIDFNTNEIAII